MRIEIDEESGFCFGVVTAIRKAEEELDKGTSLFCLGDIVHNSAEVDRLAAEGLQVIDHACMQSLTQVTVLLRAHGEPPSTYALARQNNIQIIDATCPVVLRLQQRIREACRQYPQAQVVIYGKAGHAEVNGLVGQTDGDAIVVESEADLTKVDVGKDVLLFSQTTCSIERFRQLQLALRKRLLPTARLQVFDTICRKVANRRSHLQAFAAAHDVILFAGGRKSSNAKVLYEAARQVNPRTWFVSDPQELQAQWWQGAESVGVCGATSTPRWQMQQIADAMETMNQES